MPPQIQAWGCNSILAQGRTVGAGLSLAGERPQLPGGHNLQRSCCTFRECHRPRGHLALPAVTFGSCQTKEPALQDRSCWEEEVWEICRVLGWAWEEGEKQNMFDKHLLGVRISLCGGWKGGQRKSLCLIPACGTGALSCPMGCRLPLLQEEMFLDLLCGYRDTQQGTGPARCLSLIHSSFSCCEGKRQSPSCASVS